MNLNYFFINSITIQEQGLDIGFELYCPGHILWLAAIGAAAGAAAHYYRKMNSGQRLKTKKFFAVALLLFEVIKDIMLVIMGVSLKGYLPLHLCGLAIFDILYDAFGKNRHISVRLLAYAFMPGALSALLFCNWTEYPFFNFMCIHSFVFHGWILIYFAMLYAAGEIWTDYKGLWQTAGIIAVLAVPIYILNNIIDENYLFLSEASEGSPLVFLWDVFGVRFGQPGYVISFGVLAVAVFHVLYAVYRLMQNKRKGYRRRGISG